LFKDNEKTLIITTKSLRKELTNETDTEVLKTGKYGKSAINHYSNIRGLNQFKEFENVVILDRNQPNNEQLEQSAKALWFDTKTPGDLSAEPFISHLERALGKEAAMYLLDVLSYRLQYPNEKKPHIAFYFYHEIGGMGKSLFLETLRNVLGQNSVNTINTTEKLNSISAAELWNTSWLAIEEAGVAKGSKIYDTIKSYTGADQVDADAKHKGFGKKEIPAMLMLMSNRAPTFIEAHDR
jgi:phage/plasmid-associated DNA primase